MESSVQAEPLTHPRHTVARAWRGLLGAIAFLTIVPVSAAAPADERFDLAPAVAWFPVIGAVIGVVGGAIRFGLDPLLGRGPSTVIAIAAIVAVTGALHQDGLADTFDGLGVRGDHARRLSVMRDSALGTFGVLALIVWALLLLSSLGQLSAGRAFATLIAAETVARLGAVLHARGAPAARPDGLGASLHPDWPVVAIATILAAGIAVLAAGPARAGLGLGICAVVAGLGALLVRRAIGGSTGDTLGATAAVTEALVCVALAGTWH